MAKKTISKIAALALAGATVASTFAMSVSALTNNDGVVSGTIYGVTTTTTVNGVNTSSVVYYTTIDAAKAAGDGSYTSVALTSIFGYGKTVYVDNNCIITNTDNGGAKYTTASSSTTTTTTTTTIPTKYRYADDYVYLSHSSGTYYPNLSALLYAEGSGTAYSKQTPGVMYSSTNCYFNPTTGTYLSYNHDGYAYTVTSSSKYSYSTPSSTYRYPTTYSYYSNETGMYYPNLSALRSVEGSSASYKTVTPAVSYSSTYNYFNPNTGSYTSTATTTSSYKVSTSYYYDYYDYYGYYYGDYSDPYYYYWLSKYHDSSNSKDTTTATIGNKKGWKSIANYLKKVSNGSSVTVDMNKETEVPSSVLSAIDGRNVTVKFVLDNGVTFTVNGKDVTSAKDVDLDTEYNTKSISDKLIKAAYKKNDAVSSAQISIDEGSFGFTSDVTVKFNAKRAGYKAKLYRYNASKNNLSLVDSATIGSNGKCTFDNVTKGGEFLIVLYK